MEKYGSSEANSMINTIKFVLKLAPAIAETVFEMMSKMKDSGSQESQQQMDLKAMMEELMSGIPEEILPVVGKVVPMALEIVKTVAEIINNNQDLKDSPIYQALVSLAD